MSPTSPLVKTAWLAASAVCTFTGLLPYLAIQNRRVERAFKENITDAGIGAADVIAASPTKKEFAFTPQDAAHLAMGAALVYRCAPNIARKAEDVDNGQGDKFVKDDGEKTQIWDASANEYVDLDNLYQAQHKDGLQIASYYNQKTNEVLWNFGGTDYSNARDILAGGQIISGGLAPRVLSAGKAVTETLAALKTKFTAIDPKTVTHKAYMHSTGIQSYAAATVAAAHENIKFSEAYDIDGYGGKPVFQAIADTLSHGDKAQSAALVERFTEGIVSFNAHNEVEQLLAPMKLMDPLNIVGPSNTAVDPVGGTVIDMGKTKHKATNYIARFIQKAKL